MNRFIKPDTIKIIYLFIFWKVLLFTIAASSPLIFSRFNASFPYYQETLINTGLPHFIWSFGNFDGVHYLRIAQDGYAYQFTQAFFPFYPILIKIGSVITFGNHLIAALLISNLAFLVALIIFYKLVKKTYDEKIALWSSFFAITFPTSFYFGAVYTEGIFFLMIVSAFYLYDTGKIWQASLIGAIASATRLIGIFLAPALIRFKERKSFIPLFVVPLGLVLYMLFLKIEFNNSLYFLTAQSIWGQERSTTEIVLLPQVFWRYLKILATTNGLPLFNASFELVATVFALLVLFIGRKLIRSEWLIFSLLAILTPTLTGTLASMPRYVLVAFPMYIILAHIKNLMIKRSILAIFIIILIITTALFTRGYWVA